MTIQELKEHIINEDFLLDILDDLEIEYRDKGAYLHLANPDGDNKMAITIYKNSLKVLNSTRGWSGDLFNLIAELKDVELKEAFSLVNSFLGIKCEIKEQPRILKILKEIEGNLYSEDYTFETIPESIIEGMRNKIPSYMWLSEGINLETQREFEILYDMYSDSIMIPVRGYEGELVGIKNRKNQHKVDKMKYFYSYPYKKTKLLYNYFKAWPYIKDKKSVIVVESEKSVMKLWQENIRNVVAISGSDTSLAQVIKLEQLNVDIIYALDKDIPLIENCHNICLGCTVKCIKKQLDKFIPDVSVSCVLDKDNLLSEKDSPIDKGIDIFKKIFKNRFKRRI